MLFQLVDRICAEIAKLPAAPVPSELKQQVRNAAPEAITELTRNTKNKGNATTEEDAANALALIAYTSIRSIPHSARAMAAKVNDRTVGAGQRCAIASILAYLVQPHDLIPDTAPGFYGYLDDAILLQAGMVEYLGTFSAAATHTQQNLVQFLMTLTPVSVRPAIQLSVGSLSQIVHLLSAMGPEIAEFTLQMIVANPLSQPTNLAGPSGYSPGLPPDHSRGFWSRSGNYIEGNNIVMGGGGPALINGELFIPD